MKYFHPVLHLNIAKKLFLFANTSIDISDGLMSDLEKIINKQKLSYKLFLNDIPISNNLKKLVDTKIITKLSSVFQVMIIKYYLLLLHQNLESFRK